MHPTLLLCALLGAICCLQGCAAIWCYRCTSATPGCADNFHWRGIGYWGSPCPEDNDICVKLTERKGAAVTITRDCLSSFRGFRTDMPADHYEGCREAAQDVRLAHYVFNNTITQLDIRRDHFDSSEFCFCFLDHRCNGSPATGAPGRLVALGAAAVALLLGCVVNSGGWVTMMG